MPSEQETTIAELLIRIVSDNEELKKSLKESDKAQKDFNKSLQKESKETTSKISDGFKKSEKSIENTKKETSKFIKTLQSVNNTLAAISAGSLALFANAIRKVTSVNIQARAGMFQFNNLLERISNVLAKAAMPVFRDFVNLLERAVTWFENLDEKTKKAIARFILLTGIITSIRIGLFGLQLSLGLFSKALGVVFTLLKTGAFLALAAILTFIAQKVILILMVKLAFPAFIISIFKVIIVLKNLIIVFALLSVAVAAWAALWVADVGQVRSITKDMAERVGRWIDILIADFKLIKTLMSSVFSIDVSFWKIQWEAIVGIFNIAKVAINKGLNEIIEKQIFWKTFVKNILVDGIAKALKKGEVAAIKFSKKNTIAANTVGKEYEKMMKKIEIATALFEKNGEKQLLLSKKAIEDFKNTINDLKPGEFEEKFGSSLDKAAIKVDKFKAKIKGITDAINNLGKPKEGGGDGKPGFFEGFDQGMAETLKNWDNWGNQMLEIGKSVAQGLQNSFQGFFVDAFNGQIQSAKQLFLSFRNTVIQAISKMISQMLVFNLVKGLGGLGGGSGGAQAGTLGALVGIKHLGGMIKKAHEGLSLGETLITAQTGEGVLSRQGMAGLGGEPVLDQLNAGKNIQQPSGGGKNVTINAIDSKSFREYLRENSDILNDTITESTDDNSDLRRL